ncbi:MAG: hypothetical protein K6G24_05760 [Lachnospiraceae bacterium]|nr:hypothetical protein [Lachnospiraceae bacterium]
MQNIPDNLCYRKDIDRPLLSAERSAKPLCELLLIIYTVNTVFFPQDTFHLKIVSLIALLVIGVRCWMVTEVEKPILVFGLFLTAFTIIMSIVVTGDIVGNIRGGYMGFILLLWPIIKYYRIDFEKILMRIIVVMAWFIVALAMLDYFKIIPLVGNPVTEWFNSTDNGGITKLGDNIYNYWIFLKASPMLVIAMPYCYKKKSYINFLLVFAAMFFSGTRANQIISILGFASCIIFIKDETLKITVKVLFFILVFVAIINEGSLLAYFKEYFAKNSSGDAIRRATKEAIIASWREKPLSLFTGAGYTGAIFDPMRKEMMPIVEVSYWNLLRQVGLFPFIMMMGMFLYPLYRLVRDYRKLAYAAAYLGYLAICYNDPLLYSSTGMTVLLFMYYTCFKDTQENKPGRNDLGEECRC